MSETPNTVHGRLLEAVHISGYSFERACSELEWLLDDDRWKSVGGGHDDINVFLATIDLSEFRIAIEQRKKLAKRLREIDASQRATAKMLGVDHKTIAKDLAGEKSPQADQERHETAVDDRDDGDNSPSEPPAWFQDADPDELAKKHAREAKRQENRAADEARISQLTPIVGKYKTLIIDPPWDYGQLSIAGRAAPLYATMTHDELLAFDLGQWAEDNCHLYLWTTNNFIGRAYELMGRWGFAYKTMLTWVKPRWGLGSHFRNSTEHVLFGIRGELRTRSDSIATHFEAPVGEHSEKPDKFYEIVRAASYGPVYGEIFQRAERPDFENVFVLSEAA